MRDNTKNYKKLRLKRPSLRSHPAKFPSSNTVSIKVVSGGSKALTSQALKISKDVGYMQSGPAPTFH